MTPAATALDGDKSWSRRMQGKAMIVEACARGARQSAALFYAVNDPEAGSSLCLRIA